jgi:hypothetical protein
MGAILYVSTDDSHFPGNVELGHGVLEVSGNLFDLRSLTLQLPKPWLWEQV